MSDKPLIKSIEDTVPEPEVGKEFFEVGKEFFEVAKLVEPAAKPKRHHPTMAELRALQARVEALEALRITLEAQIKEQVRTITQLVSSNDKVRSQLAEKTALIAKLQAEQREQGYWESQWRNEAAAREWAEAKLYERKAKADAS